MGSWLRLHNPIDWDYESYPLHHDLLVIPFFILLFPTIRFLLDRFIFELLARRLILGKTRGKQHAETRVMRKKLNKFKESAWKCVYFLSSELFALFVTYNEPWFTSTKHFWVGPEDQVWPDQKVKLKLKTYYMYAAGFYSYSIFALIFWETRRSDFAVSMAHHITSVILIVSSYILRFSRVGSVVLVLHEGCDVFLETAKMFRYSGIQRIADIFFVLFTLSWLILRLICFPFWIIWSTSYEVLPILDMDKNKHQINVSLYYYLFNALLLCLLACHIYWWRLMILIILNQAKGGTIQDVRSDSESDNEHED
ncbi:hypothetical protein NMG60_11005830 [Bertholletia excelsa]